MLSDYDEIINMANEEAADIITNILLNVTVARGSAKSMTSLRTNQALILAITSLRRSASDITPNMLRANFNFPPINGSYFENGPYIRPLDEHRLGGNTNEKSIS